MSVRRDLFDLFDRVMTPTWDVAYQRGFEDGADSAVLAAQVSSGEVAVQIGRALWATNPRSVEAANRRHAYEMHKQGESWIAIKSKPYCFNPDPAVEAHNWIEIPEFGNQFLELCTRCNAERTNMQRLLDHMHHLGSNDER